MPFALQALGHWPLPALMAVQAQAYGPQLIERAEVLASKLAAAPAGQPLSWGVAASAAPAQLLGYAIACPWHTSQTPQWNHCTQPLPPGQANAVYVHDIAISPAGRGQGLAARLLAHTLAQARAQGLAQAVLVAVQGAESYWQRQGFAPTSPGPDLASFGPGAVWMWRAL